MTDEPTSRTGARPAVASPAEVTLDEAVRSLAPRLLAFAAGCVGERSRGEDLAQEALAALVDRWRRHGPPESPEAFTYTIVRRRARRWLRQRSLHRWLGLASPGGDPETEAQDGQAIDLAAPDPDPERRTLERLQLVATRAALADLRPKDREALLLAAVGEVSSAEGARILGLSVSAFKMRLSRARERLAHLLEEREGASRPRPQTQVDGSRSPLQNQEVFDA